MKKTYLLTALLLSASPALTAPIDRIYTGTLTECGSVTGNTIFVHVHGDDEAMVTVTSSARLSAQVETGSYLSLTHADLTTAVIELDQELVQPGSYAKNQKLILRNMATATPQASLGKGSCPTTLRLTSSATDYLTSLKHVIAEASTSPDAYLAYLRWRSASPPVEALAKSPASSEARDILSNRSDAVWLDYEAMMETFLAAPVAPEALPVLREILLHSEGSRNRDKYRAHLARAISSLALEMKAKGQDPAVMAATTPEQICANRSALAASVKYSASTLTGLPMAHWSDDLHNTYLNMQFDCTIGKEFSQWINSEQQNHRIYRMKQGWLMDQLAAMSKVPLTLGAVEAAGYYTLDPAGVAKYAITSDDTAEVGDLYDALRQRAIARLSEELVYELRAELPELEAYATFCSNWAKASTERAPRSENFINDVRGACHNRVMADAVEVHREILDERLAKIDAAEAANAAGTLTAEQITLSDLSLQNTVPEAFSNMRHDGAHLMEKASSEASMQYQQRLIPLTNAVAMVTAQAQGRNSRSLRETEDFCEKLSNEFGNNPWRFDDDLMQNCINAASVRFGETYYAEITAEIAALEGKPDNLKALSDLSAKISSTSLDIDSTDSRYLHGVKHTLSARHRGVIGEAKAEISAQITQQLWTYLPLERVKSTPLDELAALCTSIEAELPETAKTYFNAECLKMALPHKEEELAAASAELNDRITKALQGSIKDFVALIEEIESQRLDPVQRQVLEGTKLVADRTFSAEVEAFFARHLAELEGGFRSVKPSGRDAQIAKTEETCKILDEVSYYDDNFMTFCRQGLPEATAEMDARFQCESTLSKAPDFIRDGMIELPNEGLRNFATLTCSLQERGAVFSYDSDGFWSKDWYMERLVTLGGTPFKLRTQVLPYPEKEGQWMLGNFSVSPNLATPLPQTSFEIAQFLFGSERDLRQLTRP